MQRAIMSATYTIEKAPQGANYLHELNVTGWQGEAIDMSYSAALDTGTFEAPSAVVLFVGSSITDTGADSYAADTISVDTANSAYSVTVTVPTAAADSYGAVAKYYRIEETRGANQTFPFGGKMQWV